MRPTKSGVLVSLLFILDLSLQSQPAMANRPGEAATISSDAAADVSIEASRRLRAEGYPWEHEIKISLPPSYKRGNAAYPVLWVTDGQYHFDKATAIVNDLSKSSIPEMIVVGVGVPPESVKQVQMRRVYDFSPPMRIGFEGFGSKLFDEQTKILEERVRANGMDYVFAAQPRGGAPAFLAFLVDKVRPVVARDYRMGDEHILYGHSGGGVFCMYVVLIKPQSFKKYLCTSPNLYAGNYELFRIEDRYSETHSDLSAKVFLGAGEGEVLQGGWVSAWGVVSSMARMAEIMNLRRYPSLTLYVRIFPGEEHAANALSLREGLRTLWKADAKDDP